MFTTPGDAFTTPVEMWIDLYYADGCSVDFRSMGDNEILDRMLDDFKALNIPVVTFKVVNLLGSKRVQMMWHFVTEKVCTLPLFTSSCSKGVYPFFHSRGIIT